jgi:hypothetical protein
METINFPNNLEAQSSEAYRTLVGLNKPVIDIVENKKIHETFAVEGSETFLDYVYKLGLVEDPNLIVLSSIHHYYYDVSELKNVTTLVNIKQLNHIDKINDFLKSIFHVLPYKANLIGCFEENNRRLEFIRNNKSGYKIVTKDPEALENGIVSKNPILNMLYSFMDAKTNNFMTRKSVTSLLNEHGFRVLDFSVLNGLTYFHAKNERAILGKELQN